MTPLTTSRPHVLAPSSRRSDMLAKQPPSGALDSGHVTVAIVSAIPGLVYAHCSQKISSMRRSVVYDGSLQARQAVDHRRHSLGVDSRETASLPVCHATTRQDVGYLLATARVHAIVLICRSVAQPGWEAGGHAPPRNCFHKKIPGCAVELNTQNCAWFDSQIS